MSALVNGLVLVNGGFACHDCPQWVDTAFERLLLAHSAKSIKLAFLARWSVSVELTDQARA